MIASAAAAALVLSSAAGAFADPIPIQSDNLETWLDGYAAALIKAQRTPGMVVILVDVRRTLLAKGYGVANLEQGRPFDPETTVVSAASVAKAFTALAPLQLYERGAFQLDDDVNLHLRSFKVPDFQGRPVTIRQLLTHTDGFEARIVGDGIRPEELPPPLREAAQQYMPRRILPPGEQLTYGSYASNLLGVLIEDVSGKPYAEFVEASILQLLGMTRTTFRQPLPEAVLRDLAPGTSLENGVLTSLPLIRACMAPQGGLYTTAADMGRFMQMLLNCGVLDDVRVAKRETIDLMLTQQFTDDPRLPGITYGLFEVVHRGQRLLTRDGDGLGTRSRMVLLPEARLGLFVSYTSEDDEIREAVVDQLLARFFPAPTRATPPTSSASASLEALEGTYRPLQWDQTTPGKLALLFANQIRIQRDPDQPNLLRIEPIGMGDALGGFEGVSLWREREPMLFEVVRRGNAMLGETIVFKRGSDGEVYLHSGSKYHSAYVKVPWYETPEAQWGWLAACVVVLSTTTGWIRNVIGGVRRKEAPLPILAHAFGFVVAELFPLAVLIAFGHLFMINTLAGIPSLVFGIDGETTNALNALVVFAGLTVGLVGFAALAWVKGFWTVKGRVHYMLVALAAVGLVLWLNHWNILGYRGWLHSGGVAQAFRRFHTCGRLEARLCMPDWLERTPRA